MLKNVFKGLATVSVASLLAFSAQAADVIKLGAVAPKSGPLAGGATVTQWPNVELWSKQINARGGLNVGGRKMMIEVIEGFTTNRSNRFKKGHSGASTVVH